MLKEKTLDGELLLDLSKKSEEHAYGSKGNEVKLKSIVNSSLFWIWEVNEKFYFTNSNSTIEKNLGYSKSEILKKHLYEVICRKDLVTISDLFENRPKAHESSIFFTNMFLHKNGSSIEFETNCIFIRDDNNCIIGLQGISKITNQHYEEKSLERNFKKLNRLNNLKDLFISEISYDLRSYAQIILSISQMLSDENLEKRQLESLKNSGEAISSVLKVVDYFSKTTIGSNTRLGKIRLSNMLKKLYPPNIESKINIVQKFNPSFDFYTTPLLKEIIKIYVNNLVSYSEDTIEIFIEAKKIKDYSIITIKDFGLTISVDKRGTIFKKQFQISDNRYQESILGTEIGKEILELQKGDIWIEPNTPSGNCLNIKIYAKPIIKENISGSHYLWE